MRKISGPANNFEEEKKIEEINQNTPKNLINFNDSVCSLHFLLFTLF